MGFKLLLANPSEDVRAIFRRESIFEGQHPNVQVFPDLDRALEWSEDEILAAQHLASSGEAAPIVNVLRRIFDDPSDAVQFRRILEPYEFEEGTELVEQGALSDDLFYIESGQVMIRLSLPDGSEMRVRTMDAGTFVGEVAFYLGVPRSASVVGTRRGRAYRVSRASIEKLRARQPRVATAFHEYMARTLADKLVDTTRLLSVLRT
jgi:SulP family sulfate permease